MSLPILMTIFIVAGLVIYCLLNVVIRRWDAFIISREDYDEDVDESYTKAQKAAFQEKKALEATRKKMPFGEVFAEKKTRFVLITLLGAGIGALLTCHYGMGAELIIYFIFFAIMTVISFIDLDTMEIPPTLNLMILVLGIIAIWAIPEITLKERIIGALCIGVPMILLNCVIAGAFGFGDIKLIIPAGFLLGWKIIVIGFFAGAIVASIISLGLVIFKKKGFKSHIPFGPSLCIGIAISTLWGTGLMDWYIGILKTAMGK